VIRVHGAVDVEVGDVFTDDCVGRFDAFFGSELAEVEDLGGGALGGKLRCHLVRCVAAIWDSTVGRTGGSTFPSAWSVQAAHHPYPYRAYSGRTFGKPEADLDQCHAARRSKRKTPAGQLPPGFVVCWSITG